ncbi:unnamed protein product [Bubo scandiacus]
MTVSDPGFPCCLCVALKKSFMPEAKELIFFNNILLHILAREKIPALLSSHVPSPNTCAGRTIPSLRELYHFIWLIFFYWYFHSCLNCVAELLQFGDWQWYLEWNADSLLQLWSRWSPAHRRLDRNDTGFCTLQLTHVYKLLLHHDDDKWQAWLTAFLRSACFCEYPTAISLQTFRFGVFTAMLSDIQLSCMWKWLSDGCYNNMRVGDQLVLGPSLMVLLYFQHYYTLHC